MTPLFEIFDVLPRDYEKLPDQSIFDLADIDQVIPGSPSKEHIIAHLRIGLQNVLKHGPLVGGQLHDSANVLSILRHNRVPIQLHVHHVDLDPKFSSYQALEEGGFKPEFFANGMTPPDTNLSTFRRDGGCPVVFFQANFIRGGLILSLAFHHGCGDAKSIDHVYVYWAASTKASINGQALPIWKPNLDRSYFSSRYTPSISETEELKKKMRSFTFHELSNHDASERFNPPERPATSVKIYNFSAAATARLKERCKPSEEGKFVSSYDCIAALSWRCLTRARIPFLKIVPEATESTFSHAAEIRDKFGELVSKDYSGNGFFVAVSKSFNVGELIGDINLAKVAEAIRQSTLDITAESIPNLVKVRKGIEGREEMRYIWHPQNVVGTSWMGMQAYTKYDFGFGLPISIRLPTPPFEGVFGVMPADRIAGRIDGFDVYVVMENGCQDRLATDVEYSEYCSLIG